MSVSQYQSQVNSLDKEIASLEKKKSDKDKEFANLQKRISDTQKSITKNTSASTVASKLKQISGWQSDAAKKYADSADLGKKIADKRTKRNDCYTKLQKEQQNEQKKADKANQNLQASYEAQIKDLQKQITSSMFTLVQNNEASEKATNKEYDVFISHAWEDKEDFVEEFVSELEKLGLKVWYDKKRISLGDSMRDKIDEGLRKSHFGIVVLSPNYIDEGKYWTKSELNGLFQKESIGGKVLIPIWHKLTKKDVMNYSLILADRLAMNTASYSPAEIAVRIKETLEKSEEKN